MWRCLTTRVSAGVVQEMGAEFYPHAGEMSVELRSSNPHMDSPLMLSPVTDQNFVVIRMKYQGAHDTAQGSFYFRAGAAMPPALYAKVCV